MNLWLVVAVAGALIWVGVEVVAESIRQREARDKFEMCVEVGGVPLPASDGGVYCMDERGRFKLMKKEVM